MTTKAEAYKTYKVADRIYDECNIARLEARKKIWHVFSDHEDEDEEFEKAYKIYYPFFVKFVEACDKRREARKICKSYG